ncbi:cupin domain-containing protein [Pusillimonas sp. TS35]|uniref:cupin domain-containing protein n=1 Tax=Paracandidimonas lactea TaxID=2895524 RepID=UPI001371A56E|nr:cupin domain-containing protein [Paracandidimonas lactea]MYN14780.1 cupin domain-containing protein [Pusillimonas sp. TS35]
MRKPSWIVREQDVIGYSPANHLGTVNRRLISPETVGSRHVEVLVGTIEKNQGALPHAHPGIEQVCYLLSGTAEVEVEGERGQMQAGDCCYFPPDKKHVFTVTSDEPARLLVIYTPPYEEHPARVTR